MVSISINSSFATSSATSSSAVDPLAQMRELMKKGMDAAAKTLNMKPSELMDQLKSGKSLKDVAAAQGVDFSKVQGAMTDAVKPQLDSAVAAGTLTSTQASDALSKLTSGDKPVAPAGKVGGHGHHGGHGAIKKTVDAASQALGMSSSDLVDALKSGQTLQDIAKAKGVDFSKVQSAITDAVKPQLDAAVSSGKLTSSAADALLKKLSSGDVFSGSSNSSSDAAPSSAYSPSGSTGSTSNPGVTFDVTA